MPTTLNLRGKKALKAFPKLNPNLEVVDARGTSISDLTPVAALPRLRALNLRSTKVQSIEPLAKMRSLECLWLEKTRLKDLSGVEKLSKLKLLWIHDTPVTDGRPLAAAKSLEELDIANVKLDDFSFLAKLRNLRQLDLYQTRFEDVALLAKLPKLELVRLTKTRAKAKSPEVLKLAEKLSKRGGGVSFDTGPHWTLRPFVRVPRPADAPPPAKKSASKAPATFTAGPGKFVGVLAKGNTVCMASVKMGRTGARIHVTKQKFKTEAEAQAAAKTKAEAFAKKSKGTVNPAARKMILQRLKMA